MSGEDSHHTGIGEARFAKIEATGLENDFLPEGVAEESGGPVV